MLSELSLDHATSIDNNIIEFLGVEARTVLQSFDYRNGGINLESNIELTLLYRLMAIISKNENWTVSGYLVTLESCF